MSADMQGSTVGPVSDTGLVTSVVQFQRFTTSSRSLQTQPLFLRSAVYMEKIKCEHNVRKTTVYFGTEILGQVRFSGSQCWCVHPL